MDGELELSLEETDDFLTTEVRSLSLSEKIQNITLSTMDGEKVSDYVPFEQNVMGA